MNQQIEKELDQQEDPVFYQLRTVSQPQPSPPLTLLDAQPASVPAYFYEYEEETPAGSSSQFVNSVEVHQDNIGRIFYEIPPIGQHNIFNQFEASSSMFRYDQPLQNIREEHNYPARQPQQGQLQHHQQQMMQMQPFQGQHQHQPPPMMPGRELYTMTAVLETAQNKSEKIIKLSPGRTSKWNQIDFTATSMTIPTIPIAARPLITDGKRFAILDEKKYAFVKKVQCASGQEAKQFKSCKVDPEICTCTDQKTKIECKCVDGKLIKEVFNQSALLPQMQNGRLTKVENGEVILVPELTAAIVQIRFSGMSLRTQIQLNSCQFHATELNGCYSCAKGANVKCTTDFGRALADVVCPSFRTAVTCSPNENEKVLSVHLEHYEVDEECDVFCPASSSTFVLKGKLAAPEAIEFGIERNKWIGTGANVYRVDWIGIIKKLLDFSHIWIWIGCIAIFPILYFILPFFVSFIFLIFSFVSRLIIAKFISR